MEGSPEEVVMLFDEGFPSSEELPADVGEGAVGSEMTRVGGSVAGTSQRMPSPGESYR